MALFRLMLVALVILQPVLAAEPELIRADWSRFQQEVSNRKLSRRAVRVTFSGGGEIKTNLIRVDDNGLVVNPTKATKKWASGPEQAKIPREQVSTVRFLGRIGHKGLIGGLAGLGAGVAIPLGVGATQGYEEVPTGLAAIFLGPVLGAAGYLFGHYLDKPAPMFVIQ